MLPIIIAAASLRLPRGKAQRWQPAPRRVLSTITTAMPKAVRSCTVEEEHESSRYM